MKTHKGLYAQMIGFDALHAAYLSARRGKRRSWPCRRFEQDLEGNLLQLHNELEWDQYRVTGYHAFQIHEPKTRTITALTDFRDRVVQHAMMAVLEPLWERSFISTSFACRQGKGTHAGANKVQAMMRDCLRRHGTLYALKADVRKYFASVDHAHLKRVIRRKIGDPRMLKLIDETIDSYSEPGHPGKGIPIGNLSSQLFANVYLDQLDHWVKHRRTESWYARYMDDFVVLHPCKAHLQALRIDAERYLADNLDLELNHKTGVFPVATRHGRGLDFLGYHLWPHKRRLRKASLKRFKRRVRRLQRLHASGHIPISDVRQQLKSWLAHANHGQATAAVGKFLNQHPFRRATHDR